MTATIDLSQFDRLVAALKSAPELALPLFKQAMTDSLRLLQGELKEYPESSPANRPGRMRLVTLRRKSGDVAVQRPAGYYEQGRGWWYPVLTPTGLKATSPIFGVQNGGGRDGVNRRWQREKGAYARFKMQAPGQVAGYKLIPSSEQLGRSWTVAVQANKDGVIGEVGTNTSYADVVQGEKQPALFKQRGWKTIDEILTAQTPQIVKLFEAAADEVVKQMLNSEG